MVSLFFIKELDNCGLFYPLTLCSNYFLFLEHNVKRLFGPFLSNSKWTSFIQIIIALILPNLSKLEGDQLDSFCPKTNVLFFLIGPFLSEFGPGPKTPNSDLFCPIWNPVQK